MSDAQLIEADLNYLDSLSHVNYRVVADGVEYNTGNFDTHRVSIRNGRLATFDFYFDVHGFSLVRSPCAIQSFHDETEFLELYPPNATRTILRHTGATRLAPLGMVMRSSAGQLGAHQPASHHTSVVWVQPPVREVHVDFTPQYLERLARTTYSTAFPKAPRFTRYVACSLWRVFSAPPYEYPLTVCDGRSVGCDEGVPNVFTHHNFDPKQETTDFARETQAAAAAVFHYNPAHIWWYFPDMTSDEALIIKIGDSDRTKTRWAPHSAFQDRSTEHAKVRESVEFRAIVYFED